MAPGAESTFETRALVKCSDRRINLKIILFHKTSPRGDACNVKGVHKVSTDSGSGVLVGSAKLGSGHFQERCFNRFCAMFFHCYSISRLHPAGQLQKTWPENLKKFRNIPMFFQTCSQTCFGITETNENQRIQKNCSVMVHPIRMFIKKHQYSFYESNIEKGCSSLSVISPHTNKCVRAPITLATGRIWPDDMLHKLQHVGRCT